jgi:hypothetical protein
MEHKKIIEEMKITFILIQILIFILVPIFIFILVLNFIFILILRCHSHFHPYPYFNSFNYHNFNSH